MEILFGFILFILVSIFSFYIPGRVLLGFLNITEKSIVDGVLSVCAGTALFLISTYVLAYLNISKLYIVILFLFSSIFILQRKKFLPIYFQRNEKTYLLVILIGSVIFTIPMFFSGFTTSAGVQFYDVNRVDGIYHMALVNNLLTNFPPTHPGLVDIPLKGYHYFYDFLISRFVMFYGFSAHDLYFRFFHFFISIVYGAGFLLASYLFTKERLKILLILFFAYFGQGFSYLLVLNNKYFDSVYGISQPLEIVFNPLMIFSIGLMLISLFLIVKISSSIRNVIIASLILGIVSQIKVYAGLVGIGALCVYCLFTCIKNRNFVTFRNCFIALALTAVITGITYLPNNWGAATLLFAPFLFYSHFMQQPFFVDWNWEVRRQIFSADNNILRIVLMYVEALALYWILSLGLRIITFIKIKSLFSRRFWQKQENVILFSIIISSVSIGTFFVQSTSVFDIVQFYWLLAIIFSIPTGIVLANVIRNSPQIIGYAMIFIVMAHSLVGVSRFLHWYYNQTPLVIPHSQYSSFKKFSDLISKESYAIALPQGWVEDKGKKVSFYTWEPMPVVSYMLQKSAYYEKEVAQFDLPHVYKEREDKLAQLYLAIDRCDNETLPAILQQIGSRYLVTQFENNCFKSTHFTSHGRDGEYYFYEYN